MRISRQLTESHKHNISQSMKRYWAQIPNVPETGKTDELSQKSDEQESNETYQCHCQLNADCQCCKQGKCLRRKLEERTKIPENSQ